MSKALRHLWIGRKLYLIPRSSKDILMLINQVFLGMEEINGLITFDGKKYKIDNVDVFERFLMAWLMAIEEVESDPILNDGSGMPVELLISQEKVLPKLKEFSHEKKQ